MTTPRSHSHGHSHGAAPVTFAAPIERALRYAAIACAVLTVVGLVALWPSGDRRGTDPALLDADPVAARVVSAELQPCSYDPLTECPSEVDAKQLRELGIDLSAELKAKRQQK